MLIWSSCVTQRDLTSVAKTVLQAYYRHKHVFWLTPCITDNKGRVTQQGSDSQVCEAAGLNAMRVPEADNKVGGLLQTKLFTFAVSSHCRLPKICSQMHWSRIQQGLPTLLQLDLTYDCEIARKLNREPKSQIQGHSDNLVLEVRKGKQKLIGQWLCDEVSCQGASS